MDFEVEERKKAQRLHNYNRELANLKILQIIMSLKVVKDEEVETEEETFSILDQDSQR